MQGRKFNHGLCFVKLVEFVILATAVDAGSQRAPIGFWFLPVLDVVGDGLIFQDIIVHRVAPTAVGNVRCLIGGLAYLRGRLIVAMDLSE